MSLTRVTVTGVRNLSPVTLFPSPRINLLCGPNGSGKTSFLEALHVLGMARSFRSPRLQVIIQHEREDCTVHGLLALDDGRQVSLGIARNLSGDMQIRIDGQNVKSTAQLAALLPLQLINPESFRLLEGAPRYRRQYLDWGVFHVEPLFLAAWQRLQTALKQRNSYLRRGKIDKALQAAWDREFCMASVAVDEFRQAYIAALKPHFEEVLGQLLKLDNLSLSYYRGWERSKALEDSLASTLERDISLGYTQVGPQRADLRLRVSGRNAIDVLSRGQQKQVVCALKIAQGRMLVANKRTQCVYLVDDLASELDSEHRTALCELLQDLQCQVFITCIDPSAFSRGWKPSIPVKTFHVERGQLSPIDGNGT